MHPDLQDDTEVRAQLIRAAAYHEAGHAIVAWRFGKRFHGGGVLVRFDLPGEGKTFTPGHLILPLARLPLTLRPVALWQLRAECIEYLAGYIAERRGLAHRGPTLWGSDAQRALMLVMRAHGCIAPIAELVLLRHARAAARLLRQPAVWRVVELLARRLQVEGRLTPAQIEELIVASGLRRVRAPRPASGLAGGPASGSLSGPLAEPAAARAPTSSAARARAPNVAPALAHRPA